MKKVAIASDEEAEPRKRKRAASPKLGDGIKANECIKIYIVSSKEEVNAACTSPICPVDLNIFFGEDGKIHGYHDLKITIWINSISFQAHADIAFQSNCNGGNGLMDLRPSLQRIFGETLMEDKDDFLKSFSPENNFIGSIISNGETLRQNSSAGLISEPNGLSETVSAAAAACDLKVVRLVMGKSDAGHLYSILVPLVLLLIEGSNPIDITDPKWELYVLVQMKNGEEEEGLSQQRIVAFAAAYRFYHYPESTRLRLSQILVLPAYQHKGYGRFLVETLNNVAVSEDVYDLTMEEPLDYFQNMRTCIDVIRLLGLGHGQIKHELDTAASQLKLGVTSSSLLIPPSWVIQDVRKTLRMNRKQILCCWEVLVFLALLHATEDHLQSFVSAISNHIKLSLLGKDFDENCRKKVMDVSNEHDPEMSFVMFQSPDHDGGSIQTQKNTAAGKQEQQIQQLVDERIQDIKLIAEKVHLFSNSELLL